MIFKAGFSEEMVSQLAAMKGKTFKSYECTSLGTWGYADGIVRINLGRYAVDITCDLHALEEPGGYDEMTWLSCSVVPLKSDFIARIDSEPRQYMVNEVITGVELVRDRVSDRRDDSVIVMDMAVVIRTKYHTFTLSRDVSFDDTIAVDVSDAGSPPGGIGPIGKVWPESEDGTVGVSRETLTL